MKYDYLVENQTGDRFVLVPRDDSEEGLVTGVKSEEIREVLSQLGLEDGFLSQYMTQLSTTGSVSKDLLIEEGATIKEELDTIYERIRRIETNDAGLENDVTMMGESLPAVEVAWWALRSWSGVHVLDCQGIAGDSFDPFDINQPTTPKGSFIEPVSLTYPFTGIIGAVEKVKGLDSACITDFVDQYAVTYDQAGKPVYVDDTRHLTLGNIGADGEFEAFVTILRPFGDDEDILG